MPVSIVIQLRAIQDGQIHGQTGRAVHGFWFSSVAPELADAIHRTMPAPFSISPLMGLPRTKGGWTVIKTGDAAWFRLALLGVDNGEEWLMRWIENLPSQVELADIYWEIGGCHLEGSHPWVGSHTYQELTKSPTYDRFQFEFLTPVTFNSGRSLSGKDIFLPFPLPDSLFKSWHRRWNSFAPPNLRISPDLPQWARQVVSVSSYRLKTVPVRYGHRRVHIGCVGTYTLRFINCPQNIQKYFSWLAHYAFYCGSGAKTTQGMGMTKLRIT